MQQHRHCGIKKIYTQKNKYGIIHLYKIQKQARLIYVVRDQKSNCLWARVLTEREHEKA